VVSFRATATGVPSRGFFTPFLLMRGIQPSLLFSLREPIIWAFGISRTRGFFLSCFRRVFLGFTPECFATILGAEIEELSPKIYFATRRSLLVHLFLAYRISSHGPPHNTKGNLHIAERKFSFFILHFELIS
jgi:hypothetical protein